MAESPTYNSPPPPKNVRYKNKQSNGCLMLLMFIGFSLCGLILLAFIGMMAGREDLLAKFVGNSLAMIRIEGPIFDAEDTVDQIRKYARNPRISGIILRIDSPGGTVGASQEIYSAILNAREVKPVYATMGNTAASGGYYIAAAANKIYANPGTVTGSIGVIFELTNLQELVDKIGINFEVVKSGKYKDIGSPMRPLEPQEKLILQGLINDTYEQFVEAIMATRKDALTVAQKNANTASDGFWQNILVDDPFTPPANAESLLRRIADGRLYSGRQALRLGLVDAVGSEGDCITALGKALGLEDPNIIEVKAAPSLMNMLFGESASALRHGALPGAHLSYRMHVEPEN